MPDQDQPSVSAWIGREERRRDDLRAETVLGFEALVNDRRVEAREGSPAGHLTHWLLFHSHAPLSEAGPDGHPHRGGFLPPITLPRRMWAGGRLEFLRPLTVGAALERRSRIAAVEEKTGRQGPLTLVTVAHEIADTEGPLVREWQDLVFREAPRPDQPAPAPVAAPKESHWQRRIEPTPLMLFRYSALTLNGHRIHYDHPYATGVEGYPGLVVHGPLLATFLLAALGVAQPARRVMTFAYRAMRPVFDISPFDACGSLRPDGRAADLFIRDAEGALCMQAEAVLS
jgi:3-methylfumaryl-CoA hydratase